MHIIESHILTKHRQLCSKKTYSQALFAHAIYHTSKDRTRQYGLEKIFLNLLTTSNLRWIKQKATETPSQEAAKTCEKLTILIESSSIVLGITLI